MPIEDPLTEEILRILWKASEQADAPPWRAVIEGRDQIGGDSFIQVGEDGALQTDMYVTRDRTPASSADLEVIALARTYLPVLVAEVRRLRADATGAS